LYKNDVFHDESKHIEIRYHLIHDMMQRGAINLQYVGADEQVADVLTKPMFHVKFKNFLRDNERGSWFSLKKGHFPRKGE
jgi:hypothetical protein